MRVICPHTTISPETRAALDASGYAWEARGVSASDTAYSALLAELWADGETFAVVEHDIIPPPGALPALEACPGQWCCHRYPYGFGRYAGLGLARFSAGLLTAHPDAMERAAEMYDDGHPPGHWCRQDAWLSFVLESRGLARCRHEPDAGHLHSWPSHGCWGSPPDGHLTLEGTP